MKNYNITAVSLHNTKPPFAMVEVAEKFILYYIREWQKNPPQKIDNQALDKEDIIDYAVDEALDNWEAWAGSAFNKALENLKLVDIEN